MRARCPYCHSIDTGTIRETTRKGHDTLCLDCESTYNEAAAMAAQNQERLALVPSTKQPLLEQDEALDTELDGWDDWDEEE